VSLWQLIDLANSIRFDDSQEEEKAETTGILDKVLLVLVGFDDS